MTSKKGSCDNAVVTTLRPVAAGRVAARRRIHALRIGYVVSVHGVDAAGERERKTPLRPLKSMRRGQSERGERIDNKDVA